VKNLCPNLEILLNKLPGGECRISGEGKYGEEPGYHGLLPVKEWLNQSRV
jgi:hypothetical protein